MKGKNLVIMGLPVLAAGIILIIAYQSIRSTGVVITGGILFILSGVLNAVVAGYERRRSARSGNRSRGVLSTTFNVLACIGAVTLGICMLIFQNTFVALIPYIFGVPVAVAAIYQLYLLAYGSRPDKLPGWLYIVPLALAGASIYLFLQKPGSDDDTIMLTTGIALSVFGLATVAEGILPGYMRRRAARQAVNLEKNDVATGVKPLDTATEPYNATAETLLPNSSDSNSAGTD